MTEIAARASSPRIRAGSAILSRLLWCLAAILLLCQATIWLQPASAELAVLEQFAVQLSGVAVLAALIALLSRRWLRTLLFAALAVTLAWPVFAHRAEPAAGLGP